MRQPAAQAPAAPSRREGANGGLSVEDVRDVKQLADHLGLEKVWALMDVINQ